MNRIFTNFESTRATGSNYTESNHTAAACKTGKLNTAVFQTIAAILFAGISFSASADRPAMENDAVTMAKEKREQAQLQQAEAEHTAQQMAQQKAQLAEQQARQAVQQQAPSSVERIMQQQSVNNVEYQTTGDVIALPPREMQRGETISIKQFKTPRRGITMDAVTRELGQPITKSASIGQPPITHWTYQDRIVYFEYSRVLHVLTR